MREVRFLDLMKDFNRSAARLSFLSSDRLALRKNEDDLRTESLYVSCYSLELCHRLVNIGACAGCEPDRYRPDPLFWHAYCVPSREGSKLCELHTMRAPYDAVGRAFPAVSCSTANVIFDAELQRCRSSHLT